MTACIAADRLFWTIINAPGVRAGRIPAGLWPLFEEEVPFEPGQLWAVGTPIDDGRFAVCAIRTMDLTDLAPGAAALIPGSVPAFIPAAPSAFNFLIGEHEPKAIRRARLRRHLGAAACVLATSALCAIGLWRRAGAWDARAEAARSAADALVASIAPRSGWTRDDLALELMQRRQTVPGDLAVPADAAQALAGLIARWPTQVPSKPQSISATGTSASIAVTVPGEAQGFLGALRAPEGWTMDEPRLAAVDKATRLNIELRREGAR